MDNTCHKLKMLSNCIFLYKFSMDFHIRITTSCKSCKVDRGICLYCFSFQNAYSYFFIWLSKIEMTWPWFIRNTLLRLLYLLEAQLWRTRITTQRRKKTNVWWVVYKWEFFLGQYLSSWKRKHVLTKNSKRPKTHKFSA